MVTYLEGPHCQAPAAHVGVVTQLAIDGPDGVRLGLKLVKVFGQLLLEAERLPNKYLQWTHKNTISSCLTGCVTFSPL